jgi:uncharacterized protein YrrD
MMQFNQNERVFTADGKDAGHIDRVVIDPQTKAVTHLVVRTGFLSTKDKVVPIEQVLPGPEGQLALQLDSQELAGLSDFAETQYVVVEEENRNASLPLGALYPPNAGGTPRLPQSGPKVRKGTRLNIPSDTVAVKEGAKVVSSDGKQVGHVEQVLTSPPGDHVTHFLISKGLLVKEKRLIPTVWVNLFTEDEIDLVIKSSTVEKLPVIEPA